MNIVVIISNFIACMALILNFVYLWDGDLASYLKFGYLVLWSWISAETWIKFVDSRSNRKVWIIKYWLGLNAFRIALFKLDVLQIEEDDKKLTSVLVATHHFLHVFVLDDLEIQ